MPALIPSLARVHYHPIGNCPQWLGQLVFTASATGLMEINLGISLFRGQYSVVNMCQGCLVAYKIITSQTIEEPCRINPVEPRKVQVVVHTYMPSALYSVYPHPQRFLYLHADTCNLQIACYMRILACQLPRYSLIVDIVPIYT